MSMVPYDPKRALYAESAEQAVIGCLIRSPKAMNQVNELTDDDFFAVGARRCFHAARTLSAKNSPVDLVTLGDELARLYSESDADQAMQYAYAAVTATPGTGAQYYAQAVHEASTRRQLIAISDELSKLAMDGTEDVDATIDIARGKLRNMVASGGTWLSMQDLMLASFDWLDKKATGKVKSMSMGIQDMDRATGGLFPGEMTIIGARPSVGKTAFGLQLAVTAAESGAKVCFISVEMSPEQMGNRALSREAGIHGTKIRNAKLDESEWSLVSDAMVACASMPISFMHGSSTIENIRQEIQRKVDLHECDLVIVDYLQLIRTKRKFDKEHERLGYISRSFKEISLDLKIPVVVLAQVRRQNNGGKSRCPALDELRGSGDMEQDADNVIFLHRPDDDADPSIDPRDREGFYDLKSRGYQYIVFNVAKQRQGRVGILGAAFDPACMRYINIDRRV